MKLTKCLEEHRDELLTSWVEAVFQSYPKKAAPFLHNNPDPFTNPVASMVREAAAALLKALEGEDVAIETVKDALDRFIKIRAVQDFTPSQAMGVIYLLKPLLRKIVLPTATKGSALKEYLELESRVDTLALLSFDMYVKDRDTVAEIRIKEIRSQYSQLKRWAQQLNAQAPLGEFVGCGNQTCGNE
ncbi:MAG: RsbRD N-terminal domain-containing protein [Desulfovibrio sp.]|nr:RsbRD N-terminal domain-containing protein [Desulfovibrio sp.]